MNQALKELRAEAGGINTFYLRGGQGEPILFLHGVPSFSYLWRNVMAPLANDFLVVAPDLPGYAQTGSPTGYGLKDYAKWLRDFHRVVFGDEKINLVVHDAGGPIGIYFALEHPEIVDRLIIMDTLVSSKDLSLAMRLVLNRPVMWAYYHLVSKGLFKTLMRSTVYQKDKLGHDTLEKYYEVFRRDKRERTSAKLFEKLLSECDSLVGARLPTLECPTLCLWADKDYLLPVATAQSIQAQIKGADLITLPECGHFSQEEEPELIAKHIREFCAVNPTFD